MFKHTPGPWQLTTVPFELRNTDSAAAVYGPQSKEGGACLIAEISRSPGEREVDANAVLISLAPEMAQILMKIRAAAQLDGFPKLSTQLTDMLNKINHA